MNRFLPFYLLFLATLAYTSSALAPPQATRRCARGNILHVVFQPCQASRGSTSAIAANLMPTDDTLTSTTTRTLSARRLPAFSSAALGVTAGNANPPMVCDRCGSSPCQCFY